MNDQLPFQILLVEDSHTAAQLAEYWLEDGLHSPFELRRVERLADGLGLLVDGKFDLVVLDLNLPDSFGLDTFRAMHGQAGEIPIVVLSGDADVDLAVEAVRLGAQDYVVKEATDKNPLARPARFAVERSRRQQLESALRENERQLFVARSVQQHLFPDAAPTLAGFDIAGRCDPADMVGGDYFDYMPIKGGTQGLMIADVSGHGLAAALIMVETRAILRSLARSFDDLGTILTQANEIISPDLKNLFVAAMAVSIRPETRTLQFSSAGFCSYLLPAVGETQALSGVAPPLGVWDRAFETSEKLVLQPGDVLVMLTDGLTDMYDGRDERFGTHRVLDVVRQNRDQPAAELVSRVFQAAHEFSNGVRQPDDNTLVILKVLP